jgi:hypothetical protein
VRALLLYLPPQEGEVLVLQAGPQAGLVVCGLCRITIIGVVSVYIWYYYVLLCLLLYVYIHTCSMARIAMVCCITHSSSVLSVDSLRILCVHLCMCVYVCGCVYVGVCVWSIVGKRVSGGQCMQESGRGCGKQMKRWRHVGGHV